MKIITNSYSQFQPLAVTIFQRKSYKRLFLLSIILICIASCKKDVPIDPNDGNSIVRLPIPRGFPYPDIPLDNQITKNRIVLGRELFFDPIPSRDSTISCSSCHHSDKYFNDNLQFSIGIDGREGERNAPSLLNVAYQPYMFWDGGNPTLEQQVLAPIDNHKEMDFDVNKVIERIKKQSSYISQFKKAYGQEPNVYTLTRAIACYERTLIGITSKYDAFLQSGDSSILGNSAKNGMNIFFGERGECFHCHQGYNFTDYSFRNNGLYSYYADSGRARITQIPSDVGRFKVPSLRNVEKTAPYMHDGDLKTLEEVVAHYVSGGKPHPNKSPVIKPLTLTESEKTDLVNFLKTLTSQ